MSKTLVTFLLCLFCFSSCKVKLVIDTIRHGAREPLTKIPFFTNNTIQFTGLLTSVGERQHCLLGRLRRHQYIEKTNLLPEQYDPNLISVRSTDVPRTLVSAQSYLIGLYPSGLSPLNENQMKHTKDLLMPPINIDVDNETISELENNAVPFGIPIIPITSVDINSETLLVANDCPMVEAEITKYYSSDEYKNLRDVKFKKLWEELMMNYPQITWDFIRNGTNSNAIADYVIAAHFFGQRPSGIPVRMVSNFQEFIGEAEFGKLGAPMVNKVWMSEFSKEILGHMQKTIDGQNKLRYILYSAHDTTLVSIILALKSLNNSITHSKTPDFASNVLMELDISEDDNSSSVIIYYNGVEILRDSFSNFNITFAKTGDMGMTRQKACKITSLRAKSTEKK